MLLGQVQSLVAKRVGIRVRRKRGSHIRGSGEHRAFGVPMNENCTLWTLMGPRFESVFFASFLCRFGQRNDVPPRTVANSDKENIRLTQTTNLESSNPALTPTANLRTQQPAPNPRPSANETQFRDNRYGVAQEWQATGHTNASNRSGGTASEYKKPWAKSQPTPIRKSRCSVVSTPSAMTFAPSL